MGNASALKLAIDLTNFPGYAKSLRSYPLPHDVFDLIRIAAGDRLAIDKAAQRTFRSRQQVREAAEFYVEQILLCPEADCYRVLGARSDATHHELRRNMAVLLRWLHPDRDGHGERAVFASRVTDAWDNLKTKERRAAYDRAHCQKIDNSLPGQRGRSRNGPSQQTQQSRQSKLASHHLRHRYAYAQDNENLLHRILLRLLGRRGV